MSMQQALGVIGGVVGFFFGYPQLGFVIGSLIGAALTPKEKAEGPRLDDLKVTVSTYGNGIPTLYGTMRLGGNVVWSTNKIEIAQTSSSGKGGGTEQTTYMYVVHMGIVLCKTPEVGDAVIRKIWRDGKLVWDASSGVSMFSALASANSPYSFVQLYQGHEDQMPDGIEEVYEGIGNVPAYRGIVRLRMNAVDCPGGRVPQFTFEVSTNASNSMVGEELVDFDTAPDRITITGLVNPDGSVWNISYYANAGIITVYSDYGEGGAHQLINQRSFASGELSYLPTVPVGQASPIALYLGGSGAGEVTLLDLQTMQSTVLYSATYLPNMSSANLGFMASAYDPVTHKYALSYTEVTTQKPPIVVANGAVVEMDAVTGLVGCLAFYDNVLYIVKAEGGNWTIARRDAETGDVIGTEVPGPAYTGTPDVKRAMAYLNADVQALYVTIKPPGASPSLYRIDPNTMAWEEVGTTLPLPTGLPIYDYQRAFYANEDVMIVGPNDDDAYHIARLRAIDIEPVRVKDIIADQCRKAGLEDAEFDVTGIPDTDTVWGYVLTNPASARNNIQPLMTAYAIDATEEEGKIKFFKREDITSVVTIPYTEFGCVEAGAEPGDPMPLSRVQEKELPRKVSVSYVNPNFDYQTSTEPAQRQATTSQNDQAFDIPIATGPEHAAKVAQMILYDAWNEQNRRSFKVSRRYSAVSAGDGVTITLANGSEQLWRITKATDTGVIIEWEGVPADADLYTQTAEAADDFRGQEVLPLAPNTRVQVLDIPILRDEDNNAGPYVALSGFTDGFRGAQLLVGPDDVSLASNGSVQNEAPIGYAETELGDFTMNVVDEANLVTVNVGHHELSTITRDALLSGTSNVAALGAPGRWEILKYQRVDDLGGGRYILSGLLRGQRGTEWATGLHEIGDTFVVLSLAGMLRAESGVGTIGSEMLYEGVSVGRDGGLQLAYTNTGEGLKPFSPVDFRKTPSGSDLVLTWQRRTRMDNVPFSGSLPLGEAVERYEIEIWDSSYTTLKRTLTSSVESVTYTSAMQSADGYSSGPVYARVFQISDTVGRGRALEAAA